MNAYRLFIFLCCFLFLLGCKRGPSTSELYDLPATVENGINVVVEIPAGTSMKIEYRPERRDFITDTLNGRARKIDFLPYPANYGFIPSTLMDTARGGDGDALDVLLISEFQPVGSVIPSVPIATLLLRDRGEIDTKIIAVPMDSSMQVIDARNFEDFLIQYDGARRIIEDWFLNYKGLGVMEFVGWKDEVHAREEIEKWKK